MFVVARGCTARYKVGVSNAASTPAAKTLSSRILTAETMYGTDAIHHTAFELTGEVVTVGRSKWKMATDRSGATVAVINQGGRCFRSVQL